jgi:hypothetical protein
MEEGQTQNNFEDTKRVIRIRKWKKARHCNGEKKKDKRTNNDRQIIATNRAKLITLKEGGEPMCSGRVSSSYSTSRRVALVTNPVISHKRGKVRIMITTNGKRPLSFVTQICHNC